MRFKSRRWIIQQDLLKKIISGLFMAMSIGGLIYGKRPNDQQNISVSGYLQVRYTYDFQDRVMPNNEFEIPRARIKFRGTVTSAIRGIVEMDCGEGELKVKDIGIDYQAGRSLNLFIGQTKMPFSREQLRPASDLLVIDRGVVNDTYNEYGYLGRDLGLTLSGDVGTVSYPVHYAVGVYNGNGVAFDGDIDDEKQYVERLEFGPVGSVAIGLNSTQRSDPLTHDVMIAYGGDFLFQKKALTFEGEILTGDAGMGTTMAGGNITGAYRIGAFEPAVKFERLYPDVQETGDHTSIITGHIGWHWNPQMRLQTDLLTVLTPGEGAAYKICAQVQVKF